MAAGAQGTLLNLHDTNFGGGTPLNRSKCQHQHYCDYHPYPPGTTIVAVTDTIGWAKSAGTILLFQAQITGTIATDPSRTVTIDCKKAPIGGAFATILSSTIVFTNASALLVATVATLSITTLAAGDTFEVVVTVAGGAGNQALGLHCLLVLGENP